MGGLVLEASAHTTRPAGMLNRWPRLGEEAPTYHTSGNFRGGQMTRRGELLQRSVGGKRLEIRGMQAHGPPPHRLQPLRRLLATLLVL